MNEFSDESNNTNDIPEFFLKREKNYGGRRIEVI